MISYLYLGVIAVLAGLWGFYVARSHHLKNKLEKTQKKLTALEQEKAVAETQVKHYEVRKKNEEKVISRSREQLIDSLRQQGDLRD